MKRAKHFRRKLTFKSETSSDTFHSHFTAEYPPIALLVSKVHPSVKWGMKDGPHSVLGLDFDTMPKEEGDGRVTYIGALPPEGTLEIKFYLI